jgi:hypothetical protein
MEKGKPEKDQTVWLSLEAAIAWIATRDAVFTHRVQLVVYPAVAITAINDRGEQVFSRLPANLDKPASYQPAWLELRSAILAGRVEARGRRGQQVDKITEVASLVINGERRFSLATATYPLTPFVPWTNVKVPQADLFHVFPPLHKENSTFVPRHGKGHKVDSVVAALVDLANKHGGSLPSNWREQKRWDEVKNWLKAKGYEEPKQSTLAEGYRRYRRQIKSK